MYRKLTDGDQLQTEMKSQDNVYIDAFPKLLSILSSNVSKIHVASERVRISL